MLASVSKRVVHPHHEVRDAGPFHGTNPTSSQDVVERGTFLAGHPLTGRDALRAGIVLSPRASAISPALATTSDKDRDPIEHVRVLASDAMQGRDSPSPGLDAAAQYISDFVKRYGLVGPNADDPVSPYYQTFSAFAFAQPHEHEGLGPRSMSDRPRLFEYGFSAPPGCTPEDIALLAKRMQERNPQAAEKLRELVQRTAPKDLPMALANTFEMRGRVQNVVAKLEGTGPHKDEVIVVMAHYDHVGARFGRVYNGADDNASGSAALMAAIPELVEMQKRGELDRSIVFLWTAA